MSDAGPLIAYLDSGAADLLFLSFDIIYIPEAVHREVFVARPRVKPKKIKIQVLDDPESLARFAELIVRLDHGEAEAIALAEHLRLPLLIDEKAGRRIADESGIEHMTTVELLRDHIATGRIPHRAAERTLRAMRLNGVYLPADINTA